ncbi:hypothetical protein [Planococcus sp. ISL-110]|uniref:hypothetical protein n=1 Tax=Planococcus sp. ISL-110 TaxID=2819167 RepID=UPI002036654B|nr:hypothetical protein [Planococcus sp. ISL-110]
MAFSTAVQQAMVDNIDVQNISAMAFSTSLETLMQERQAAMMISVNTAIIFSANNSSDESL